MGLYVFALADALPAGRPGKGLTGALSVRKVAGAFAIVERRADVPPADFGTLTKHQQIVQRLAAQVPAILPVRFGTLLNAEALEEALHERDDDLAEAFEVVRGRVQFTWRRKGPKAGIGRGSDVRLPQSESGADYLRRAAKAARPTPSAPWRTLRMKLAPLVVAERYQAGTAKMPDSLYHLVERNAAVRYAAVADALQHASPLMTMTGPWPPFAFAPEML